MTTIVAFKEDGVWNLYADSRISAGHKYRDTFNKVRTRGSLSYSIAGAAAAYTRMEMSDANSVEDLLKVIKETDDSGPGWMLATNGKVLWELEPDGFLNEISEDNYLAIGSGSSFALGALAMGATPEQAIKIAMKFDSGTGGRVRTTKKVERKKRNAPRSTQDTPSTEEAS